MAERARGGSAGSGDGEGRESRCGGLLHSVSRRAPSKGGPGRSVPRGSVVSRRATILEQGGGVAAGPGDLDFELSYADRIRCER